MFSVKPAAPGIFLIVSILVMSASKEVRAQAGALDPTFNTFKVSNPGYGSGPNSGVSNISVLPDGKTVFAGGFSTYDGWSRHGIAKLNPDGSLDETFLTEEGYGPVNAMAVQPDGKILVGGYMKYHGDAGQTGVARFLADGSHDPAFTRPVVTAVGIVNALALQADGKIIIGGTFTTINGVARKNMARLNANGTLDLTFDPGAGATGFAAQVQVVEIQTDGKILVGGSFSSFNGVARNCLTRLNSDGSVDTSFDPGTGATNASTASPIVEAIELQPDGKAIIGGSFSNFSGVSQPGVARINSNGSRDTSFNTGTGAGTGGSVYGALIMPDGRILVGGNFSTFNNQTRRGLVMLNADGSIGAGFDGYGTGLTISFTPGPVYSFAVEASGNVIVGGGFQSINQQGRNYLAKLKPDGSVVEGFNERLGMSDHSVTNGIGSSRIQPDGKIVIAGGFESFNGVRRDAVARLNADGSLDPTFVTDPALNIYSVRVGAMILQPDGKVVVGVSTDNNLIKVLRFNPDGSLDTGFDSGLFDGYIFCLALQPDSKIVVTGNFHNVHGASRNGLVRLNPDGSLDNTFTIGAGGSEVDNVLILPDGKMIITGYFDLYNYVTRNQIARLNANGTLDTSFDPGSGFNYLNVNGLVLQPDGKILIGGDFTSYNGVANTARIFRMNTNGSVDGSFQAQINAGVDEVALQADGKVLVVGNFTAVQGLPRPGFARLNADGSLDTSFTPETMPFLHSLSIQADGKIIIGGSGAGYGCIPTNGIARILIDKAPIGADPTITSVSPSGGSPGTVVTITGTNFSTTPALNQVMFNRSAGTIGRVTSSTSTSITVVVPEKTHTGFIEVKVGCRAVSTPSNFTFSGSGSTGITISTQPNSQTVCSGSTVLLSVSATGPGALSYQWQKNGATFTDLTEGSGYTGVNTAMLSINTTGGVGTGQYRCKVSGAPEPDAFSNVATLTVNNTPPPPTTTGAANCEPSSLTVNASGGSPGSYRWYTAASGGAPIAGATNSSYVTPFLSASTTYYVSIVGGTCESTRTPVIAEIKTCSPPVIQATTISAPLQGLASLDLIPLVSTISAPLNIASMQITIQPASGAVAVITNGILELDYAGTSFSGTDRLTFVACDQLGNCTTSEIVVEVASDLVIYNAVSKNEDGKNDLFYIQFIDVLADTRENKVAIFNRWGDMVFEVDNYDNKERSFNGTGRSGNPLPSGTYFYRIQFASGRQTKTGFISLK